MHKKSVVIDIVVVPLGHNVRKTETTKIFKYQNLTEEIKRVWKLESVEIILILVIAATGQVTKVRTLENWVYKNGISSKTKDTEF